MEAEYLDFDREGIAITARERYDAVVLLQHRFGYVHRVSEPMDCLVLGNGGRLVPKHLLETSCESVVTKPQ